MSDKVNMSLDDVIKKDKSNKKAAGAARKVGKKGPKRTPSGKKAALLAKPVSGKV